MATPRRASPRSSSTARRVRAQALLSAAAGAEKRYRVALVKMMRGVHAAYMHALLLHLHEKAMHQDSYSRWRKKLDQLDKNLKKLREPAVSEYDAMASAVTARTAQAAKTLLGATPPQTGIADYTARVRDENIGLIENAAREYAADVREVFDDPANFGLTVKELQDKLVERGSVSESRAELIARDQTLKFNAGINRIRQVNAGIERYVWSTSHDERVRPEHAELDGQVFSWSSPPQLENGPLHPGQDYNCRCVALPLLEEEE